MFLTFTAQRYIKAASFCSTPAEVTGYVSLRASSFSVCDEPVQTKLFRSVLLISTNKKWEVDF